MIPDWMSKSFLYLGFLIIMGMMLCLLTLMGSLVYDTIRDSIREDQCADAGGVYMSYRNACVKYADY